MKVDDRAFPLYWPEGSPRAVRRERSRFKTTLGTARQELLDELSRLGARKPIISTNLNLRPDGLFRIDDRKLADPGAAVYFHLKDQPRVMACDRWDTLACNLHALSLTIDALRGIQRWGSTQMVEQAFRGFTALPPAEHDWRAILGIDRFDGQPLAYVKERYRQLALAAHPDRGGSEEAMTRLNLAMAAAEQELGTP